MFSFVITEVTWDISAPVSSLNATVYIFTQHWPAEVQSEEAKYMEKVEYYKKLYQSFYDCLAPVLFYDINTTEFIFYDQLGN